jgi:hypothetical protein
MTAKMIRINMALFLLVQVEAFSPFSPVVVSPLTTVLSSSTSTELEGLRSFLRRKLFRGSNKQHEKIWDNQHDQLESPPLLEDVDGIGVASEDSSSVAAVVEASFYVSSSTQNDNVFSITDEVHPLPPRDETRLTKYEREFRDMLSEFAQFTQRDIAHVKNARLRSLFEGIAASYYIPETYRAFEILFEDYAPLRIGGRLIYAQLKQAMLEAQLERQQEVESISQVTGLDPVEIENNRIAWLKMAVHHQDDKAAQLTMQQLIDLGLAETVAEVLGHEDFEGWLNALNQNFTTDRVTFCELMCALQNCPVETDRPECNPNTLLPEIAKRIQPDATALDVMSMTDKKKRYAIKYDDMVKSFLEWREVFPAEQQSRKMDVLRGCYAGAQSEDIVRALRIVYLGRSESGWCIEKRF